MTPTPASNTPQPTFVEEPATYVFQQTFTANQSLQRITVPIDRDADFLLTGINGSSTGTYSINFRLPSGRLISSANMFNTNFVPVSANQPNPIGPPAMYRAGSNGPELDITETSGAPNTVQLVFSGIRRIRTA